MEKLRESVLENYGLQIGSFVPMAGYGSTNYKIVTEDEDVYVLKLYNDETEALEAYAESEILLQTVCKGLEIPKPIFNNQDGHLTTDSRVGQYRILSFLKGQFWGDVEIESALLGSLGSQIAKLQIAMKAISETSIKARINPWDLRYCLKNQKLINFIPATDRALVSYYFDQFEHHVINQLDELEWGYIQGDFNDWNILTKDKQVCGLIDFGDMCYSPLIFDLAIALSYACVGHDDPVSIAIQVIEAYNHVRPLKEEEIAVLYYCVAARLCTGVSNSAHKKTLYPDDPYYTISEKGSWNLLRHWIKISPIRFEKSVRASLGISSNVSSNVSLLDRRKANFSNAMSMSYDKPIHMEKAAFQYMYDAEGNTFLDAYNNIPLVGHCHPRISKVISNQSRKLNTNTRYLYDSLMDYSDQLLSYFPTSLNKVFFVNSGSAASDLAIRLCKNFTRRNAMGVLEHGYHGNTQIGIEISAYKYNSKGGLGAAPEIYQFEMPLLSNGKRHSAEAYAIAAVERIKTLNESGVDLGGFIAEPIIGCGGQVPLTAAYAKAVSEAIREQGGVYISDEVQLGFGRLGTHFWGFEYLGIVPDMVILGKPMGNGHPLAAVITTTEIADAFDNGMEFFSSFGGNPVSSIIGKTVLDIVEEEQLQLHAQQMGEYFIKGLQELKNMDSRIADVRGVGLFLGVELVEEDGSTPNTKLAHKIKNEFRARHILTSTDGTHNHVLKIKPPLCFNRQNADRFCAELLDVLKTN